MHKLLATLALALILAPPATAGVVAIDPVNQTVENSRFRLVFDYDRPELVRNVVFKDWSPLRDIASEDAQAKEYWGQTLRGVNDPGFMTNMQLEDHTWEVLDSRPDAAFVRVTSSSPNQPPVTTDYTFIADQPWYFVRRTVRFSVHPDTGSFQMYAARVGFVNTYRALRYRDITGAYLQRGYCYTGCATPNWDGRWLEHISITNSTGFSVAQIYPASVAPGTPIVRGFGPESYSGWVAKMSPGGLHDRDLAEELMVAFSTTPGDTTTLDSLWWFFNHSARTLAVPPSPPAAGRLRLAASPNPAAGPVRFAWRMGEVAHVRLEVLDAAGRRVALPFDGEAAPGEHAVPWDGRGDDGRRLPPGVYLARLATPRAVATTRVVRVR
jgi:hypothetical protein